jgi:predicted DNA-binding transcriptional regulator YafY
MSLLERIYYFHSRIIADRFPNSGDLVREFEISAATAHRDIAYLRDRLLAPLAFSQRHNGYFYTDSEFHLPFEDMPRLVLLLGLLQKLAGETGLDGLPEFKQLRDKLADLVSTGQENVDDLVHCEWIETEAVDSQTFADVLGSLLAGFQLSIAYRSPDGRETEREIDPLKLVNYQGRWYILAWCHLRRDRRLFHLARISRTEATGNRTRHRLQPNDDWLSGAFGIFKGQAADRYPAKILFRGTAAEIVRCQRWHAEQQCEQTEEGLVLTLPVADDRELLMKVLQFGAGAQILSPDSLRVKAREELDKMVQHYHNQHH